MAEAVDAHGDEQWMGSGSVWQVPGMPWLLGSAALWFSGFALLVPVAPLWVIRGGSDDLGAGLVTGVMMACTVLAQLSMRRVLAGRVALDARARIRIGRSHERWQTATAPRLMAADVARRPRSGGPCPGRSRRWS